MDESSNAGKSTEVKRRPRRRSSMRGFTSVLMAWAFLILAASGAILYVTPRGRDANWTNWTLFGLSKDQWAALHVNLAILFLVFAAVHLVLNWKIFWAYLAKAASPGLDMKWEMALATLLCAAVAVGAVQDVAPFSVVMEYNEQIKDYWSRKTAEQAAAAPVAHAEDLTLAEFVREIQLPLDDVLAALREEGYEVHDGQVRMSALAASKGVAPRDVFVAIRKHFPAAGHTGWRAGRGGDRRGQGPGFGPGRDGLQPTPYPPQRGPAPSTR
ncbi:MAG TPA: DUF4405 domain-containing protein [Planctomycetaceae bacterium]|nr:DUF4405 domain-containing protein [Planctomycetaceae bacterium]